MQRALLLWALGVSGMLYAQDGAALYQQRCASCHASSSGRTPSMAAIKKMTPDAVYASLASGPMKTQAAGLSTQQLVALLVYIAPEGKSNATTAFRSEEHTSELQSH